MVKKAVVFHETYQAMSMKSHRNFIDFLTDHEKHVSDRQTARCKATPGATGKTAPECQKLHVFYIDQSLMNISHSPPTVQSLVIPTYPRTRIPAFYTCRWKINPDETI